MFDTPLGTVAAGVAISLVIISIGVAVHLMRQRPNWQEMYIAREQEVADLRTQASLSVRNLTGMFTELMERLGQMWTWTANSGQQQQYFHEQSEAQIRHDLAGIIGAPPDQRGPDHYTYLQDCLTPERLDAILQELTLGLTQLERFLRDPNAPTGVRAIVQTAYEEIMQEQQAAAAAGELVTSAAT